MFDLLRSWIKPVIYITLAFFVGLIIFEWGADFSSRGGYGGNAQMVGVVNGEEIETARYDNVYRNLYDQQFGGTEVTPSDAQLTRLRSQAWNTLVSDVAVNQEIDRLGITVSEEDLYYYMRYNPPAFVQQVPSFLTDGRFDYQKYLQAMTDPGNAPFWAQVEAAAIPQLRQMKMQEIISSAARVTPEEIKDSYLFSVELAQFDVLMLPAASLGPDAVTVTDEDIQDYYRRNTYRFQRDETRSMEIALFSKDITEADWERVREEAKLIADTVRSPEVDFALFAEVYSEDNSASDGGDIGSYPLGDLDSLYVAGALALEIGGISEPVRSSFGWHIIKLIGMKDADGKETTDADKCAEVHTAHILFQVQASDETVDNAERNARDFFHSADKKGFAEAAEEHGVTINNIGFFTRGGTMQLIGQDFFANEWAFNSKVGDISGIYSNASNFFVMRLTEIKQGGDIPLDDIRASCENLVKTEKLKDICLEQISALHATLTDESDFESLATGDIQHIQTAKISRRSAMPTPIGLDPKATGAAFSLTELGEFTAPLMLDRGAAIIKLIDKESPSLDEFTQAQDSLASTLLVQKQQEIWNSWYSNVVLAAKSENYLERRIADGRTFVDTLGAF